MADKKYLTVAIQKNGRLNSDSLQFLGECGLTINFDFKLYDRKKSSKVELVCVRDDDIPRLVAEQICDVGIVGKNVFLERKIALEANVATPVKNFEIIRNLGFGACRLSFAVPNNIVFEKLTDLNGKKIATSYPYLLKKFLLENNINAQIVYLSGSVEIAPKLKLADIICDLVATGNTLLQHDLREVYCILNSEAILFTASELSSQKQLILSSLVGGPVDG
jgi:ATP phosphoribosyltransferase